MKILVAIISIFFLNQNLFSEESSPRNRGESFNLKRNSDKTTLDSKFKSAIDSKKLYLQKAIRSKLLSQQQVWEQLGPGNIGGRVRSIAVHPTEPNKIWIASASGGIWHSSNGGNSWIPQFDEMETQNFGAICIDPNRNNVLYAASGEGAFNLDSYNGRGIYKSTNSGQTWQNIGLRNVASFNKIYVHPLNSDLIYAGGFGSDAGLYFSSDGGKSWDNILKKHISDISLDPKNTLRLIISTETSGVYHTENRRDFNLVIGSQELFGMPPGRASAQYSPEDNSIAYALVESAENGSANIFKSLDGGRSWTAAEKFNNSIFGANDQGFYNNFISIDPSSSNNVLLGGVQLFRSGDGFTFNSISRLDGTNIHVDQHCVSFAPSNPKIAYLGNDGGVYKSTDRGKNWFPVNNGLYITQFYGMDIDESFANANYGGTQDNNNITNRFSSNNWFKIGPGDGFEPQVSKQNPNLVFIQTQFGNVYKLDISEADSKNISNGLTPRNGSNSLFNSPLRLDYNKEALLYQGSRSLFSIDYSKTGDSVWKRVYSLNTERISAIEPGKNNSNIIWFGSEEGKIRLSTDSGESFSDRDNKAGSKRFISDIQSSYFNDSEVFVAYSNFDGIRLAHSSDFGVSWSDISAQLPRVPINDIELDMHDSNSIFIATDIGVYASFDKGKSWMPYGTGMPMVAVNDIDVYEDSQMLTGKRFLRAATHGRSIWQIELKNNITEPEIIFPAGGEKFTAGSEQEIIWFGSRNVDFEVSFDSGNNFEPINLQLSDSRYIWKIPYEYTNSAILKMKIGSDEKISKEFSIVPSKEGNMLLSKTIGGTPYGICQYDDKLYVCDFYENNIKIFDLNLNQIGRIILESNRRFYTDLDIDPETDIIYLSRMNNESGGGGAIDLFNLNGSLINSIPHPATGIDAIPIGIELLGADEIAITNREQDRKIYILNKNNFSVLKSYNNPCDIFAGPRGITDIDGNIIQLCTIFNNNILLDTGVEEINSGDSKREFFLEEFNINARGISFDQNDGNFWITGFNGEIRKYRGFDGVTSAPQSSNSSINNNTLNVYPNPADKYIYVDNIKATKTDKVNILNSLSQNYGKDIAFDLSNINESNSTLKIDVSRLPNGIYYISLEQNSYINSGIFVISR